MNMPTTKNQFTPQDVKADCGCQVRFDTDGIMRLAYCAKHHAAPALFAVLRKLVADGECYCPENLAVKETCPHCEARAALAIAQKEAA